MEYDPPQNAEEVADEEEQDESLSLNKKKENQLDLIGS